MSARDIGRSLGLRTNTVEVALHRALARLRHELDPTPSRRLAAGPGAATDAQYS
jgi:DNA-directed RNA polymerase specialized sigma24 family protein